MDATLLTNREFWDDCGPLAMGDFPSGGMPACAGLSGHLLFQSSGSSGVPKWIALSKTALLASAGAVNRHLEVENNSCWGLALPLHHVGGFGVAARAFEAACGFREFGRRWDARVFGDWLAGEGISHTSLVPTQVHDLVVAGRRAPASLRAIVVGGGHLDARTGQAARALGWPVLASYGMTEAASQIATQRLECLRGVYQPAPLPLLPIWRAELSPEQTLRVAGPALFSGILVCVNGDWSYQARISDWHQTSDRMAMDDESLTPLGRADAWIKVLGELVDPEAIERELVDCSAGRLRPGMFAVVAVPDARAEHALVPVFDEEVPAALVAEVLAEYRVTAVGFRRLRPAVMLRDFPRSALGKPRRGEIVIRIS